MGMVKIINDANIGQLQSPNQLHLILGHPEPTTVIVQSNLATLLIRCNCDAANSFYFGDAKCFCLLRSHVQIPTPGDPQLRLLVVFAKHFQDQFCFVVQTGRKPPCKQLNLVFAKRENLTLKRGNVLSSIIVCKSRKTQLMQHLCTLLRGSFSRIEWNNTPSG